MPAPLDRVEFDRWRAAADRTARAAEVQRNAGFWEWACFLAEQAAQLGVKGLLHGIGAPAWGHDLAALEREVAERVGTDWPAGAARDAELLSRFYLTTRDPDAVPGGVPGERFTADDATDALAATQRLLAGVDRAWAELEDDR